MEPLTKMGKVSVKSSLDTSSFKCLWDIQEEVLSRKGIYFTEFSRVLITGKGNVDALIENEFKALGLNQITKEVRVCGFKWVSKWEWLQIMVYNKYVINVSYCYYYVPGRDHCFKT